MTLALVVMAGFVILEGWVIFHLLNRVLAQAGVKPIQPPKLQQKVDEPQAPEPRRKVFSVPVMD